MPAYYPEYLNTLADIRMGARVDRAAALVTNATVNLFTIAGGRVALHYFLGEIVVAIANTATTLVISALTTNPSPTITPLSIASASIAQMLPGVMFTLPAAVGSALTISTGTSAAVLNAAPVYVLEVGGLQLTSSAAPATGTIKWSVFYTPIDSGAYMAAA